MNPDLEGGQLHLAQLRFEMRLEGARCISTRGGAWLDRATGGQVGGGEGTQAITKSIKEERQRDLSENAITLVVLCWPVGGFSAVLVILGLATGSGDDGT